jgi:hypothetical protein
MRYWLERLEIKRQPLRTKNGYKDTAHIFSYSPDRSQSPTAYTIFGSTEINSSVWGYRCYKLAKCNQNRKSHLREKSQVILWLRSGRVPVAWIPLGLGKLGTVLIHCMNRWLPFNQNRPSRFRDHWLFLFVPLAGVPLFSWREHLFSV